MLCCNLPHVESFDQEHPVTLEEDDCFQPKRRQIPKKKRAADDKVDSPPSVPSDPKEVLKSTVTIKNYNTVSELSFYVTVAGSFALIATM